MTDGIGAVRLREALHNRSPLEAAPCANWELCTLTGAAKVLSRTSLTHQLPEGFPAATSEVINQHLQAQGITHQYLCLSHYDKGP